MSEGWKIPVDKIKEGTTKQSAVEDCMSVVVKYNRCIGWAGNEIRWPIHLILPVSLKRGRCFYFSSVSSFHILLILLSSHTSCQYPHSFRHAFLLDPYAAWLLDSWAVQQRGTRLARVHARPRYEPCRCRWLALSYDIRLGWAIWVLLYTYSRSSDLLPSNSGQN